MPNKNSHAHNLPQRTCVACRTRKEIGALLSFIVIPEGIIFDPARRIQRRRHYVCPEPRCLEGLDKWRKLYMKRRFGIRSTPVFSGLAVRISQGGGQ